MNWIDILLLLVVACSVVGGLMAGFARVGVGFVATVLGILCGFWFYGIAADHVLDYVSSRHIANLIGFFAIFLGIMVLGAMVGSLLAKLFKWIGLSWVDRMLGGAFGFVRGIVIAIAMVTIFLAFAPSPPPASVVDSKTIPYVIDASNILADITPREIQDAFRDTEEQVKKVWSEHTHGSSQARRQE